MAEPDKEASNSSISETPRIGKDDEIETTGNTDVEDLNNGGRERNEQDVVEREKGTHAAQGLQVTEALEPVDGATEEKDYSSFTTWEKRFIVFTATMGAFFSPFTAQIYFPALNTIAKDLNVSSSKINLTMTTYMVWLIHAFWECSSNKLIDFASHCPSVHRWLLR
jgi:hypothetical protein